MQVDSRRKEDTASVGVAGKTVLCLCIVLGDALAPLFGGQPDNNAYHLDRLASGGHSGHKTRLRLKLPIHTYRTGRTRIECPSFTTYSIACLASFNRLCLTSSNKPRGPGDLDVTL